MCWSYSLVIDLLSCFLQFYRFGIKQFNNSIHSHPTLFLVYKLQDIITFDSISGNSFVIQNINQEIHSVFCGCCQVRHTRKEKKRVQHMVQMLRFFSTSFLMMHNLVPPFHIRLPPSTGTRKSICTIHVVKQWCRPWSTPSVGPDVIESRSGLGCLKYGLNYSVQGSHKPLALYTHTSTHMHTLTSPFYPLN